MQECLNCEKPFQGSYEEEFCSDPCKDEFVKGLQVGREQSIATGLTHEDGSPNHGATSTTELVSTLTKHFEGLRLKP